MVAAVLFGTYKAADLRNRIVSRHRSGEGYGEISAALQVPKSTVATIIRKWKGVLQVIVIAQSEVQSALEQVFFKDLGVLCCIHLSLYQD